MTLTIPKSQIIERRSELMAELFLGEFDPVLLSRPTSDVGYDLLLGVQNKKGGVNTFAVQVHAVEALKRPRISIRRDQYEPMAESNVPGLLLVTDVKLNKLYYAWFEKLEKYNGALVSISLTEIDDTVKRELRKQLTTLPFIIHH